MLRLLAGTRNELFLLLLHLELVLMLLHCGCLILQHKAADAADVLLLQMQQEHDMLQLVPPMYHALLQLHKYYRHSTLKMKSKYIYIYRHGCTPHGRTRHFRCAAAGTAASSHVALQAGAVKRVDLF